MSNTLIFTETKISPDKDMNIPPLLLIYSALGWKINPQLWQLLL